MSWLTKTLGLDKLTNKNPEIKRAIDSVTKPVNDALKAETRTVLDHYFYDELMAILAANNAPIGLANNLAEKYPAIRDGVLAKLYK